jgi:hypothetical protein
MPIIAKKLRMSALTCASGLRPLRLPGILLELYLLLRLREFLLATMEVSSCRFERPLPALVYDIPRQVSEPCADPLRILLRLIEVHDARL